MTPLFPLLVNVLVIGVIAAELVATAIGAIDADQLLIVSAISGGLTIFSFRLSRQALASLERDTELEEEQMQQALQALAQRRKQRTDAVPASPSHPASARQPDRHP